MKMDREELKCLARQLKHEIEENGQANATILYNGETNEAEIMDRMGELLGHEALALVDLKLVYNEFEE